MNIISIRENPDYKDIAIKYFQQSWKSVLPIIYEDCITHSIEARNSLPQWYLLEKDSEIIGCAGLITNDFISRGDYILGFAQYLLMKNIEAMPMARY